MWHLLLTLVICFVMVLGHQYAYEGLFMYLFAQPFPTLVSSSISCIVTFILVNQVVYDEVLLLHTYVMYINFLVFNDNLFAQNKLFLKINTLGLASRHK